MIKMWTLFLFLFATSQMTVSNRNVYYSVDKKNYNEAEQYCLSIKGGLLSYGRGVVNAADQFRMKGEVWLSPPWLAQEGCYTINHDDAHLRKSVSEASSFECISICRNDSYKYIGITKGNCACLTDILNYTRVSSKLCSTTRCGSKTAEYCGIGQYIYFYSKVMQFDIKNLRQTLQRSSSGLVALHRRMRTSILNFFCTIQDGSSTEITIESTPSHDVETARKRIFAHAPIITSTVDTTKLIFGITSVINNSPNVSSDSPVLNDDSPILSSDSPVLNDDSPILTTRTMQSPTDGKIPVSIMAGIVTTILIITVLMIVGIRFQRRTHSVYLEKLAIIYSDLKHQTSKETQRTEEMSRDIEY